MGLFDFWNKRKPEALPEAVAEQAPETPQVAAVTENRAAQAYYDEEGGYGYYGYTRTIAISFTGEKNMGEIGPVKKYTPDYDILRMRSRQFMLESEIAVMTIKRYVRWVVGKGLKLEAEPNKKVLESEGITLDIEAFKNIVEPRFKIYASSRTADYAGMQTLNQLEKSAEEEKLVAGDVLVILRYEDKTVKVQLVDGAHVRTPTGTPFQWNNYYNKDNGNIIRNGIELDAAGRHVAYWVCKKAMEFERIAARGPKSNMLMAYIVYGVRHQMDNTRAIPILATVFETIKKLDRYKEAAVGSAEERAKVVMQIVREAGSSGDSPIRTGLLKAYSADAPGQLPVDVNLKQLANTIAVSTNKQVYDMPIGTKLAALESTAENNFKDFYEINTDMICAALGIPSDVAKSKYNSNFSASRAALKDWEHTLNTERAEFATQFLQPIYNLWLYTQVLENKIQAPGFLQAVMDGNTIVIEAYQCCRFVGQSVPHIDPLKEVNAVREALGDAGKHLPLITLEQGTEMLGGGESSSNMEQFGDELEEAAEYGINPAMPAGMPSPQDPKEEALDEES